MRSPVRASILPDCGGCCSNEHPYREPRPKADTPTPQRLGPSSALSRALRSPD